MQRILVLASLVNSVGCGLYMTSVVLFLTRVSGLRAVDVGLGLTIAGLVGLVAGVPSGILADRIGPRDVQLVAMWGQGITTTCLLLVHSFFMLVVLASLDMMLNSASSAARGGLIRAVGGEGNTIFRARLRSMDNAGMALGALISAFGLEVNTNLSYESLILGDAASFVIAATILVAIPRFLPSASHAANISWNVRGVRQRSYRDWFFIMYASADALVALQYAVIVFPLPFWISSQTHAPRWTIPLYFLLNTAVCVFFQVRVGSRVRTFESSVLSYRVSGVLFLISCSGIALMSDFSAILAAVIGGVAILVHTVGELWHAAATSVASFELAPVDSQSEYQGLLAVLQGLGRSAAPALLTFACIDGAGPGWVGLGVFLMFSGFVAGAMSLLAAKNRPFRVKGAGPE